MIDFLTSPEDINLKYQFSDLLKGIRLLALFVTLLLPGLYIAITTFHQELIPTEFLFAIVASRNNVPFPIIFEIFTLEIALELIRESGVRVPRSSWANYRYCWSLDFTERLLFLQML